ncbi:serine protease FAM111A-like [Lampris incognitus]|uniref:serine protease FAM111A-like n=1 Tax=Lampris incognitus TaxID=2546036 RepID=UPI0024B4E943|nr:serine protease FAM111A-like [Lampris incognitus]
MDDIKVRREAGEESAKISSQNNKTDDPQAESSQALHSKSGMKEQKPHKTHSFTLKVNGAADYLVTCNKAQTVLSALETNKIFAEMAKKNQKKELVIIRGRRAISTHFPCHLIGEEDLLKFEYINAAVQGEDPVGKAKRKWRKTPPDETVTFNVTTKGDKGIIKEVMNNLNLKNKVEEVCMYGYKGHTIKNVLKIDGRFKSSTLKKDCILSDLDTSEKIEMSTLVDVLDGRNFRVVLRGKFAVADSQSSLEEETTPCEPPGSPSDGNKDSPKAFTSSEMRNTDRPEEKAKADASTSQARLSYLEIPGSENLLNLLRAQYNDLVEHMKSRGITGSSVIQTLRKDFGKNVETCLYMKTVKKLSKRGDSVCQLRVNDRPIGSGFLLFDRYILTNGHVIAEYCDQSSLELRKEITVTFSFESLAKNCKAEPVRKVVAFQKNADVSGCDWALLELYRDQPEHLGLLENFDYVPPSGGICIIGYPGEGVKKMDPCYVVQRGLQDDVVKNNAREEYGSILTDKFFEDLSQSKDKRFLTYETCFYDGASGSPVFDKDGNVVAMHSGGGHLNGKSKNTRLVQFAHPLSLIIEEIIFQLLERDNDGVLKKFLCCFPQNSPQLERMGKNLRKMLQGRNLTILKVVDNPMIREDEILQRFFQFICQPEEATPMDIE